MRSRLCLSMVFIAAALLPLAENARADAPRAIQMVASPAVSPDGAEIAFSWMGEIWSADIDGSGLKRLTANESTDSTPLYSPDGQQIAFVSRRTGASQIFLMDRDGSGLQQITHHSEGYQLEDWFPDGKSLLATGSRDHAYRDANRLLKVSLDQRRADQVLVDAMAEDAKLSQDGKKILFTREGERWWRKGYTGERSAQVWQYDLSSGEFLELLHEGVECMWPLWMPSGEGFYCTKGATHGFDLWSYTFAQQADAAPQQKQLTNLGQDSVVYPAISRDGKTIVFRHLFDLYSLQLDGGQPKKIELKVAADVELPKDEIRRELTTATNVAFSSDGLDVAFVAGGDVWVMDTTLREPVQITKTAGYEGEVLFSPEGDAIWFTSVTDGKSDVFRAVRKEADKYWWQNEAFEITPVTNDMHVESDLRFTANGQEVVFQQGRGDLVAMNLESKQKRFITKGFSGISFDLSADSRWVAYSQQDDDFNSEVWIADLAGETEPVNVSRHPDNDGNPTFSPDGKLLAFTGRRVDSEVDIYYVYLQQSQDEETSRDRRLEKALELMKKKRKGKPASEKSDSGSKPSSQDAKPTADKDAGDKDPESKGAGDKDSDATVAFEFDLQDIHQRLRRISIPDSYEGGLLFSPDSKKLAFSASIDGRRGWYTVSFPDELSPKFLTSSTGSGAVWSKQAGGILYSRSGQPAKLDPSGKLETYSFSAPQTLSRAEWLKAGFEKAWLTMREVWYDQRFANRNWDEIRRKYATAASQATDPRGLASVVELMLGELNGSHLGFSPSRSRGSSSSEGWRDTTAHLGVRFDSQYKGPGLLVRDVIPGGPADRQVSTLKAGDTILQIDSQVVDPGMDLTSVLNGRLDRDIELLVQRKSADEAAELRISLRPISFGAARSLLYEKWLEDNRQAVGKASDGQLGYLHIRAMSMGSFYEFERQLYNVGYGREGIVIDVRDNGGGSTTDLLLTALTQPRHAITVPRGGGQGYPHDRAVFASWSKPIIVLCNQNSYSNAEIFSHAIKTLGRGQVVGVRTAGGVVSTGSATINDVGTIRVPFRGWFVIGTGDDMEMNGCEPDVTVWPLPGEIPAGKDRQLEKAVSMLLEEVGEGAQEKKLKYATER